MHRCVIENQSLYRHYNYRIMFLLITLVTIFNFDNSVSSISDFCAGNGGEGGKHGVKSLEGSLIRECNAEFIIFAK